MVTAEDIIFRIYLNQWEKRIHVFYRLKVLKIIHVRGAVRGWRRPGMAAGRELLVRERERERGGGQVWLQEGHCWWERERDTFDPPREMRPRILRTLCLWRDDGDDDESVSVVRSPLCWRARYYSHILVDSFSAITQAWSKYKYLEKHLALAWNIFAPPD
jgi:hypothetical protein